jgi:hypothetical protein
MFLLSHLLSISHLRYLFRPAGQFIKKDLSCPLLRYFLVPHRVIDESSGVMAVVPPAPASLELSRHVDHLQDAEGFIAGPSIVPGPSTNDHLLIVSPYEEESHLLDLRTVDTANQLLAKALVGLKCLRDDYATAPYVEIFNVSVSPRKPRQRNETSNTSLSTCAL